MWKNIIGSLVGRDHDHDRRHAGRGEYGRDRRWQYQQPYYQDAYNQDPYWQDPYWQYYQQAQQYQPYYQQAYSQPFVGSEWYRIVGSSPLEVVPRRR